MASNLLQQMLNGIRTWTEALAQQWGLPHLFVSIAAWIGAFVLVIVLVLLVLLIGGAVVAVVWFARRGSGGLNLGQQQETFAGEDPLEVLRRRYARGEISREEYQAMREDLLG